MDMPHGTGKHIHQGGVVIYVLEGRGASSSTASGRTLTAAGAGQVRRSTATSTSSSALRRASAKSASLEPEVDALRTVKRLAGRLADAEPGASLAEMGDLSVALFAGPEAVEGMAAFAARRAPAWVLAGTEPPAGAETREPAGPAWSGRRARVRVRIGQPGRGQRECHPPGTCPPGGQVNAQLPVPVDVVTGAHQ